MIPVVALVGRPNVGKSTMFNRLTRSRDAIVANYSGLTRDRQYGEATVDEQRFIVIDTGGISGEEIGIDNEMAEQSLHAIDEADAVLFMVSSHDGLIAADYKIAEYLRQHGKKVYLVANKIDGLDPNIALAPFYELGLGEIYPVTATHGRGVSNLMEDVVAKFVEDGYDGEREIAARGIKIDVGCQVLMPWGAPIGTGLGLLNRYNLRTLRERIDLPLIIDAGLGAPSQACEAMEMGFDGILLNTAVAKAHNPPIMAKAFADAIDAGRQAFCAGLMTKRDAASPSTPTIGQPFWHNNK